MSFKTIAWNVLRVVCYLALAIVVAGIVALSAVSVLDLCSQSGGIADLLDRVAKPHLKWACLAHLSEENNDPDVVLDTHHSVIGSQFPLHVASRYDATDLLVV